MILSIGQLCLFRLEVVGSSYEKLAVKNEAWKWTSDHAEAAIMSDRKAQHPSSQHINPLLQIRCNIDSFVVPATEVALTWAEADASSIEVKPVSSVC